MWTSRAALLTSSVPAETHADGALSRRHPGDPKHGFGPMVGSMNLSQRTDVSSMPQFPAPLLCFRPSAPGRPLVTVTLKSPAQLVPFMFQNWMPAVLVVPGAV